MSASFLKGQAGSLALTPPHKQFNSAADWRSVLCSYQLFGQVPRLQVKDAKSMQIFPQFPTFSKPSDIFFVLLLLKLQGFLVDHHVWAGRAPLSCKTMSTPLPGLFPDSSSSFFVASARRWHFPSCGHVHFREQINSCNFECFAQDTKKHQHWAARPGCVFHNDTRGRCPTTKTH